MARTQSADYEQRKAVIVDAAADLIASLGFGGASISDLAKACGISKSLIYHYYPSKEDILYAVMASHIDQLIDAVELVLGKSGPPNQRLHLLLYTFMDHYVGAASRQKVLLNELAHLTDQARADIVGKQRRIVDAVQRLVVEILPDLAADPARARGQTMLLFGMINWTHIWFDPKGPLSAHDVAEMAFTTFMGRR
ncbi:TetR/AcrR family transcriptional regulator [Sphingorhabdus contaminans]|uniref:TetR/AcrR family transcriptional regulator n=1 Tax=Sphingorhabdus contaminans TaxID=1343899 RepID=UPI003D2B1853